MLDVAEASLAEAGLTTRCKVHLGDLDSDRLAVDPADVVICFHNVLGFVRDPFEVIRKLHSTLRANGCLLLVVPNTAHAVFYSILRGSLENAEIAATEDLVQFSAGPAMRTFQPDLVRAQLTRLGITASIRGFPVATYPSPTTGHAAAADTLAELLGDAPSFDRLLALEWKLSNDESLASRGNNLFVVGSSTDHGGFGGRDWDPRG
jgi:hypothetical protein